jgi:transposase-like protein
MAWFAIAGAVAGTIKLRCPHCDRSLVKPRKPRGERYRCRYCHKIFSLDGTGKPLKR